VPWRLAAEQRGLRRMARPRESGRSLDPGADPGDLVTRAHA
jgi:hypothetical protein